MTVRNTSVQAWREINDNKLLSKVRLEIYNALYEFGPCTYNELFREMAKRTTRANFNVNTRLGELRDMSVVSEVGEATCKVTGMTVTVWDVTSKLPSELPRKKSKKQKIKEIIEELRLLSLHLPYREYSTSQQEINKITILVRDL